MWLDDNKLKDLGYHTKSLINKGVYSLYLIKVSNKIEYLLKASEHEFYFLDSKGKIKSEVSSRPDVEISESILFEGMSKNIGVSFNNL